MNRQSTVAVETVKAVAERKGIDPSELEYALLDYIDITAIEQLAVHSNTPWTLSFELPEHTVTVRSDGSILLDGVEENTWETPNPDRRAPS